MAEIIVAHATLLGREECFGMGDPPLLEPRTRPCGPMFGMQGADALQIFLAGCPDKRKRDGPERHVEESAALGRDDVVFALWKRRRDDLDLPFVEADALIELSRAGLAGSSIRQADFCRAGFLQYVDDARALRI